MASLTLRRSTTALGLYDAKPPGTCSFLRPEVSVSICDATGRRRRACVLAGRPYRDKCYQYLQLVFFEMRLLIDWNSTKAVCSPVLLNCINK
ncbi:hypothetical protein chiPu_0003915 [Chiloscyllium punctatum]|uniref:Uncharacterized protein n=1 Tax=Chiloscyllium punctatum TaxID=137246 RepID=A0A401S536_CHIPU|nr:hypothetical protein [Chiloscyllium punctatum]